MSDGSASADSPQAPPAGSLREFCRVALPLILSSGSISLMHVVDRVFLTWHSPTDLAAAMPAGIFFWTMLSIPMGLVLYVNTFVSQYDGADRPLRVSQSVWQGVYVAIVAGLLLAACAPLSPSVFRWIGHEPQIQTRQAEYLTICLIGAAPMLLSSVLSCFYGGRGRTFVVMCVNMFTSALNVGLDYLWIFGIGPFPEMGIRGAAWATVVSVIAGVVLFLLLMSRGEAAGKYHFWKQSRLDGELLRRIFRYGIPNGLQSFVDVAGFAIFLMIVGKLGEQQLAATNLTFNLNTFSFVPMLGIGTSILILVGRRIGEGRPELAVRTTWIGVTLTTVYMGFFAIIYVVFPQWILTPYRAFADPETFPAIEAQAVILLRFIALFGVFDGMAIVFGSAIRGAGDTRFSLALTICGSVLLLAIPSLVVWQFFESNLYYLWTACTVWIIGMGIGFYFRFQARHWLSMRVIEGSAIERNSQVDDGDESESIVESEPA